jgi:hypothetical protein
MNCDEGEPEDHGIRFGEELRASPPRRVQENSVKQMSTREYQGRSSKSVHVPLCR